MTHRLLRRRLQAALAATGWVCVALLGGCAAAPGSEEPPPPALLGGAPAGEADRVVVIAVDNTLVALPTQSGTTPGLYDNTPRYVTGAAARRLLNEVAREHRLSPLAAWPIPVLGLHCATFLIPAGADRDAVLAQLARDPRVSLAQPLNQFDTRSRASPAPMQPATATPTAPAPYDDPYLPLQRNLRTLGVLDAHRCCRGAGTTVAVIDTGVDMAHADLHGMQASSANFVDADEQQFQRDYHGTEVVGIIAARPGNAQGIVGIAPEARLLLLKACWQKGRDGSALCNSFTLAQALAAAIERGAQVINLSLGGPADGLLTRLVQQALARGIVVVGASPDAGDAQGFPIGIPGVIAVRDGPLRGGGAKSLLAPGQEVLTLTPGGRYDFSTGSSLAAAHVSAAAALLLQRQPRLDGPGVERLLRASAAHNASGTPDICEALAALGSACRCSAARLALD
ncbi:MAG TPA: S8 family serine peptidase [Ideonella sp.]|nr:S8 family serine peptidase [Ideonella sp.]